MPTWTKALLIVGGVVGLVMIAICAGLLYIGVKGPETAAIPGSKMRHDHMATIQRLGLLDPGEQIQFFYSDALVDIEQGLYFFTDKKVVVYDKSQADPSIVVPFEKIVDITADFSGSWIDDSTIWLELDDQTMVSFPVATEADGDHRFFEVLKATWKRHQPAHPRSASGSR